MLLALRVGNGAVINIARGILLGAIFAMVPLVVYHLVHHSIGPWINDTVFRAMTVLDQGFLHVASYAYVIDFAK